MWFRVGNSNVKLRAVRNPHIVVHAQSERQSRPPQQHNADASDRHSAGAPISLVCDGAETGRGRLSEQVDFSTRLNLDWIF